MEMIIFTNWSSVLGQSELPEKLRDSFRITIRWYLGFLKRKGAVASEETAEAFLQWAVAEKQPAEWLESRWRKAIQWFLVNAPMRKQRYDRDDVIRRRPSLAEPKRREWNHPRGDAERPVAPEPKRCRAIEGQAEPERRNANKPAAVTERAETMRASSSEGQTRPSKTWAEAEYAMIANLRREGKSYRTEQAYCGWRRRFQNFVSARRATLAGQPQRAISEFLDHLATVRNVSVSTQRQALNAVVYFFRHGLGKEPGDIEVYRKGREAHRGREALSEAEVARFFAVLPEKWRLYAKLQYGAGLRLAELLELRVKDIDFDHGRIHVRQGKGNKDRFVPLPETLVSSLREQLESAKQWHRNDRRENRPGVALPDALEVKYPNAGKEWRWFWLFPADHESMDPRSRVTRRHHQHEAAYQRALKRAADDAGIVKRVTSHMLRHSYATHCLQQGADVRTIQEILGHAKLETTQVYLHLVQKPGAVLPSPLRAAA